MVVDLAISESVAYLTLNRPAVLNALDQESVHLLVSHLEAIGVRPDVRVVVTRGAGRAYCAGSDLRDLAPRPPAEAAAVERAHGAAAALLDSLPQPTIAMLHGYVLGGGLGLALSHDLRVAAESTVLALPEIELGWTPPWAMGRLVDVVGGANARWLALTGARISAAEAKALGLVHEVVADDQLAERVAALARRLAGRPPEGLRQTKALLNRLAPLRRPEWDEEAARAFEICFATPEAQENVRHFLTRRRRAGQRPGPERDPDHETRESAAKDPASDG